MGGAVCDRGFAGGVVLVQNQPLVAGKTLVFCWRVCRASLDGHGSGGGAVVLVQFLP